MQNRKKRTGEKSSFGKGFEDFGEEMGNLGERFGSGAERFGRQAEGRWHSAFGFLGPLISAIFVSIIFVFGIWVLGYLAAKVHSAFLLGLRGFLLENIALFFAMFLFFNYAEYFSKWNRKAYAPFKPLVQAAGAVVVVWVIASVFIIMGASFAFFPFAGIAEIAVEKLAWIFIFFAMVGYLALLVFRREEKRPAREEFVMAKTKGEPAQIKRLYRSGKDKILGGVCGGMAEYLNVDPVIIRLLWVASIFIGGFGILLYIICWIIIPRNPNHKWN